VKKILQTGFLAAAFAISASAQFSTGPLSQADAALQAGEADKAIALLGSVPPSAASHNLRCRVFFSLEDWDSAAGECQQAVVADTQNSGNHLWLGRALGEKADRASFLNAYSLGKRVREEFEEAARLSPRDADALADLGEFYYDAPGIIGGGTDKAQAIASRLDKIDPARAFELRAGIAKQLKDYDAAERYFKQAIALSEHPAFQWMRLASFYRQRGRWADMQTAVQSGLNAAEHDRQAGVALFNGSSVLSEAGRNLELASRMLQEYLAGSSKSEEGPAFVAHTRLARIDARLGDVAAAKRERTTALELAREYRPAQELKF
jgi:tetratricopeptide (TPR) repeat protein